MVASVTAVFLLNIYQVCSEAMLCPLNSDNACPKVRLLHIVAKHRGLLQTKLQPDILGRGDT